MLDAGRAPWYLCRMELVAYPNRIYVYHNRKTGFVRRRLVFLSTWAEFVATAETPVQAWYVDDPGRPWTTEPRDPADYVIVAHVKTNLVDPKKNAPLYVPDWSDLHDPLFMGELCNPRGEVAHAVD